MKLYTGISEAAENAAYEILVSDKNNFASSLN